MTLIICVGLVLFLAAAFAGWRWRSWSHWNFMDVLYYPIAAAGVVLLFASNANQRELIELRSKVEAVQAERDRIQVAQPHVSLDVATQMVDSSFGLIATVPKLGAACAGAHSTTPECIVAVDVSSAVTTFLRATRSNSETPALRLQRSCTAAVNLLNDLRASGKISPLVGDELITQYRSAASKNIHPLAYEAIQSEAEEFRIKTLQRIEEVKKMMPTSDPHYFDMALESLKAEVDFGKLLIQGLYPCIVSPQKDLDSLRDWTLSRETVNTEFENLKRQEQKAKDSDADPMVKAAVYNVWPFVLMLALCLKFAKGIASWRKGWARK